MITLEQALEEQNYLDWLCSQKRMPTKVGFAPSGWYGNALCLKEWMGYDGPLNYVIPHGIALHRWVWNEEARQNMPAYCYQEDRLPFYREKFDKVVHGAAPWLYALEMVESDQEREGTLFFPAHSTIHAQSRMEFDSLAQHLNNLPDEYQPVTVCIYWQDYFHGDHKPFQKLGMRIVSAGNMYDEQFNYRLAYLLLGHKYAASNDIGTQLFFSVAAGCSFFYVPHDFTFTGPHRDLVGAVESSKPHEVMAYFQKLFAEPREQMTAEQIEVVGRYNGADQMTTPENLRRQLGV